MADRRDQGVMMRGPIRWRWGRKPVVEIVVAANAPFGKTLSGWHYPRYFVCNL